MHPRGPVDEIDLDAVLRLDGPGHHLRRDLGADLRVALALGDHLALLVDLPLDAGRLIDLTLPFLLVLLRFGEPPYRMFQASLRDQGVAGAHPADEQETTLRPNDRARLPPEKDVQPREHQL